MRANTTQRSRNRITFFNQLQSFRKAIVGNQANIALTVAAGRTGLFTGSNAIALMVGKQQFQSGAPSADYSFSISINNLPFGGLRGAGTEQPGAALHRHHTHTASAVRLQVVVMTKCWYLNAGAARHRQNGFPGLRGQLLAVYGQFKCSLFFRHL